MAGYTRQDVLDNISPTKVARAGDINSEFDALDAAFHGTTGHNHSGGTGQGARINLNGSVTGMLPNENLADMPVRTFKGRTVSAGEGAPQDILRLEVTPRDFGGVPGGVVNASAAVQAMFDYIKTANDAGNPVIGVIDGTYGLSSGVYIRGTGTIIRGLSRRVGGFKSLSPDGFVRVGDSRTFPVSNPGGVILKDLLFDANYIGDVCLWWSYRCNGPASEGCRFRGGVFAGLFVDLDVTQGHLVNPSFQLCGKTTAGVRDTIADAVFCLGNISILGGTVNGTSGVGIRAQGSANNPYGDISIIEELHVGFEIERFTSCYDEFILVESQRVAAPILGTVTGTFQRGETITGATSGATGEYWDTITTELGTQTMRMRNIVGTFQTESISGGTSSASTTITSITLGAQNQGGRGDIRVGGSTHYIENPGDYAGQDGTPISRNNGPAFTARGEKSLLSVEWFTKSMFRKIEWGFSAEHDAQIAITGGNDASAQADGVEPARFGLARTTSEGNGTAKIAVRHWPQVLKSVGNALTSGEEKTPYRSWSGLVSTGPRFGSPARLGVTTPNMKLIATPVDGSTAALPSVGTSSGGVLSAAGGRVTWTGDGIAVGGKGFNFQWTPPAAAVNRKLAVVMTASLEQVGAVFGGTDQLPSPRVQVESSSGTHIWPEMVSSTLSQDVPAPGAGNESEVFTCTVMFEPLDTTPVVISCSFSTRTEPSDDKIHVSSVDIFCVDDDTLGL